MDIMEIIDQIGDLKNAIYSLNATINAFGKQFTERTEKDNLLAVQMNPEDYSYLFFTITGLACDAKAKILDLENAADRLFDGRDVE